MTKFESLNIEKQNNVKFQKKINQRKTIRNIIRFGFLAVIIISTVIAVISSPIGQKKSFETYRDNTEVEISEDAFAIPEAFDIWQSRKMTNDLNILLSGIPWCTNSNISIYPNDNISGMIIKLINGKKIKSQATFSCINVLDHQLVYRNDTDRFPYIMDMETGRSQPIVKTKSREVLMYDGYIYYIDIDNGNTLMKISIDSIFNGEPEQLDIKTSKYFVYGNNIVFLNEGQLIKFDIETGLKNTINGRFDDFYFYGKVVALSGNRIISFNLDGSSPKKLYESTSGVKLLYVNNDSIFIQEDNNVKQLSRSNGDEISNYSLPEKSYVDGIFSDIDGYKAIVYSHVNNNENIVGSVYKLQ